MKILMENKKRQYIYITIILVSIGVALWLWLSNRSTDPSKGLPPFSGALSSDFSEIEVSNDLLPYGVDFNLGFLKDDKFTRLVPFQKLLVTESELGRRNPFALPGTDPVEDENSLIAFEPLAYVNSANNIQFFYPKGWIIEQNRNEAKLAFIVSPVNEQIGDLLIKSSIAVSVIAESENLALSGVVEQFKSDNLSKFKDYKLLAEKTTSLKSGNSAEFLELEYSTDQYPVHEYNLIVINSGKAFLVAGSAPAAKWSNYKNMLESSILSLELTK